MAHPTFMKLYVCIILCLFAFTARVMAQESGFVEGKISQIVVSREDIAARDQRGRAFIMMNPSHQPVGVCSNVSGLIEFDTTHESFTYLYTTALTAHGSERTVQVFYDDGFGSEDNCRIIQIRVLNILQ